MNILDNELVKKYFGDVKGECASCKILSAMQEPIRKGDRYLQIAFDGDGSMQILERVKEFELHGFGCMRLPDKFQKKECDPPMEEPYLHRGEEFPIGEIRRRLFSSPSDSWNSFVRDKTAEMELEWNKYNQAVPKRECECCKNCVVCKCFCECHQPQRDEVEEKAKEISDMIFTDDDLKRLKEKIKYLNGCHYINLELRRDGQTLKQEGDWIKSTFAILLARLEAAELYIWYLEGVDVMSSQQRVGAREAWRKAARK